MKLSRILSTLLRAEPPAMFTQAELDEQDAINKAQDADTNAYRQSDVEFLRAYRQGAFDVLTALGISDDAANAGADECVEGYKDAMSLMGLYLAD
jgi:hypothetical protein